MMGSGVFLINIEVFGNVFKHCLGISFQQKVINLRRKWRNKIVKIYANEDQGSKYLHSLDFLS